jgi:Domain of unknown function (DUF4430)
VKKIALLAVLVLAGCGGEKGSATLWVTRDRGQHVLLVARVPAGLTAMQALERKMKVKTSYGGRFVKAIGDVESVSQRDWFYFVNGVPPSRSAVEVRLHKDDNVWWDYRSWRNPNEVQAVVGAFPQPFLRGPAVVVGRDALATKLAHLVHGTVARSAPAGAYVLELRPGDGFRAVDAHRFVIGTRAAARLVANPSAFRFRYEVAP